MSEAKAMLASALASVRNFASKMQFVRKQDAICPRYCQRGLFFVSSQPDLRIKDKFMASTTIILILATAVAVLTAVVAVMVVLFWRKNRELKQKNDAIVSEMYRSQHIIERAVEHGVSRAALL